MTNYNYSHLSNLLREPQGKLFANITAINDCLLQKNLFDEKKIKGNEIAERLHYASYFSFSKAFKKKFGLSPQAYKKSIEDKKNNL